MSNVFFDPLVSHQLTYYTKLMDHFIMGLHLSGGGRGWGGEKKSFTSSLKNKKFRKGLVMIQK